MMKTFFRWMKNHKALLILLIVLMIALAIAYTAPLLAKRKADKQMKGMTPPFQPVSAATVQKADMPVYLKALGTVTASSTVTVRSQVGGQLIRLHFKEGQVVEKGDLLAEIDPRPFQVQLMQAEGQLARDEELLRNAEADLARYKVLLSQDSIAVQQVTSQESLVKQYRSVIQTDKAQIAAAKLQLTYSRITAPISGRVGLKIVDPGNMVSTNDTAGIAVITQLQPITVVFSVPQDHLPAIIKRSQTADLIPVLAFDQEGKNLLAKGKLLAVDNQIDTATGTIKLKGIFRTDDHRLFPNQFVNIRLKLDTLQAAAVMPTSAIQRGSIGTFAYVIKDDQTVTVRPINLGPADGDMVAVTEGLVPGEKVVTVGGDKLREGSRVEIAKPRAEGASPRKGKRAGTPEKK
jgi:multidrug efflux system membrane fusion protein